MYFSFFSESSLSLKGNYWSPSHLLLADEKINWFTAVHQHHTAAFSSGVNCRRISASSKLLLPWVTTQLEFRVVSEVGDYPGWYHGRFTFDIDAVSPPTAAPWWVLYVYQHSLQGLLDVHYVYHVWIHDVYVLFFESLSHSLSGYLFLSFSYSLYFANSFSFPTFSIFFSFYRPIS